MKVEKNILIANNANRANIFKIKNTVSKIVANFFSFSNMLLFCINGNATKLPTIQTMLITKRIIAAGTSKKKFVINSI